MSAPKVAEEKYYRFSNYSDKICNPKVRLAVEMAFDAGCNMVRVMKHLEDVDSEYEITIDTPEFSIHAFGDIWVFRVSAKFFDGRDYFSSRRVIDVDDEMLKAIFKGMRAEAQVSQYLISYLSDNPDFHLSLYTVGETLVKGWDGDMVRVKIIGNDSKYDINHVEVEIIGPGGSSIDFETTDSIFYLDLWRTITDAFSGIGVTRGASPCGGTQCYSHQSRILPHLTSWSHMQLRVAGSSRASQEKLA